MEAVARQFATNKKCIVIRNGWFSFRWTQIFDAGAIPPESTVRIESTNTTSFACDLRKWLQIMEAYENGGFAYHATMPTDALMAFRDVMKETEQHGFDKLKVAQQELGDRIRALLVAKGIKSVAAKGYEAPGVVVAYTDDPGIQNGKKFSDLGIQIAAGVPLQCNEPEDFHTFRLGLFGLDKLQNIDRTVETLEKALDKII